MGGSRFDFGQSIAVDSAGNVYTTGYFFNTVDFDPGAGTFNLTGSRDSDGFIQKLGASGNFLWAYAIDGDGFDVGESILVDNSGNAYITGHFDGVVDFNPDTGVTNISSGFVKNIFVQKLDAFGHLVWARSIGSDLTKEVGLASALDTFGNIYTTGVFYGTVDFDPDTGMTMLTSSGSVFQDIFIQKVIKTHFKRLTILKYK
ncbi:SBBP repeat-containing protein [Vicingaceae bacterium]|nr:SBBP repeat-containing protein [Vicingaceae bacterium]